MKKWIGTFWVFGCLFVFFAGIFFVSEKKLTTFISEEKQYITKVILQCFQEKSSLDRWFNITIDGKNKLLSYVFPGAVQSYFQNTPKMYLEYNVDNKTVSPLISYMIGKNGTDAENPKYADSYTEKVPATKTDAKENQKDTSAKEENIKKIEKLKETLDRSYLLDHFYIKDAQASIDPKIFQVKKLLEANMTIKKNKKTPQILIYHTHGASEAFIDSREGKKADSVVGVGTYLAKLLENKYGYKVIHDTTEYDRINGKIDRSQAYNVALESIEKQLKKYPDIEVVIDLHRDGVGNKVERTTTVNGKSCAQVMLFNGLSRNSNGDIKYLPNENLQKNLAFSLQLNIKGMELYPTLMRPIYLRDYRYNLHVKERAVLIELGNENNTVEEAKNAMEPFAEVLNQVLSQ